VSCRAVRDWLHRDVDALDEAKRLLLDDHLASCVACRGDRAHMQRVRELGTSLPVPPAGAREYNRAIAGALLEGARSEQPSRWSWKPLAVAAVAAAGIAIAIAARRDDAPPRIANDSPVPSPTAPQPEPVPPRPAPVVEPAPVATTDVVEAGELRSPSTTIATGTAIPADVILTTRDVARLRLAAARVVVAAHSEVRWSPIERVLLLDRGSIDIETDDGGARVVTPSFELALDDGALTVGRTRVRVKRGKAQVFDHARVRLAELDAGESWDATARLVKRPPRTHVKTPTELMTEARALLAAKDHPGAERLATRALAATESRRDKADYRMFLADLAQASDALDVAVARYTAVARDFADLAVAESALYAAALIESRRGHPAAARTLRERYLATYPTGRYADDVQRQLTPTENKP
jgi:hypothetical protein